MGSRIAMLKGVLAALALIVVVSDAALATNGMQLIGIGAVQRSMGGSGSALPLDSFVITVNPAAISELPAMFDLSVTYFDPASDYESTDFFGGGDSDESSSFKSSFIPAMGMIFPVTERLTLGLAAFGSAGMGVDYDTGVYGNGVYTSFEMMKIVPALSYKISEKFSLGAAVNINRASMAYKAGGMPAHDKDTQYGFGFQVGAYLRPSQEWSLALAYISEESFSDFEFDTAAGKDTLDLDLPQQMVFGVGYRPTDLLRLAFDVKWINWAQTMGKQKPRSPVNNTGQRFDMDWSDQLVFALGAEYDLVPEQWKLRAGYNYGKAPLTKDRAFENIAFPALVEHHFTAGLGYSPMKNLWVNLGGVYAPTVSISGSNQAQAIGDYETSLSEYSIDLGFCYTF